MDEQPRIDLSALDPSADRIGWERRVRAIAGAAAPELARRREEAGALVSLSGWVRPVLAAAAVLAVVSIGAMGLLGRGGTTESTLAVSETLGLPAPLDEWLAEEQAPPLVEVLVALEGEPR